MKSKISDIQIIPIKPKDGLVGFLSFVYDNNFYLGSMGIYTRSDGGYRITYPTRKGEARSTMNYYHPINKDISKVIETIVKEKYSDLFSTSNNDEENISDSQLRTLLSLIDENVILKSMMLDHYEISSLEYLKQDAFDHCLNNCLKVLKAQNDINIIKNAFPGKNLEKESSED